MVGGGKTSQLLWGQGLGSGWGLGVWPWMWLKMLKENYGSEVSENTGMFALSSVFHFF